MNGKDVTEMLISEIEIGERFRKDVGNIDDLAKSIATVGQLQPVVITADNKLIAGLRRIRACESIGLQSVLVAVAHEVETARQFALAERDENTCRKDFTPSEAVAIGMVLEKLESPAAKKRREAGGNLPQGTETGKTRDIVAESVGMSGRTYEKAKEVVEAASKPDAKPEVIQAALTMDQTGKVDPAHKIVKASTSAEWIPPTICQLKVNHAIKDLDDCPIDEVDRTFEINRVVDWLHDHGFLR